MFWFLIAIIVWALFAAPLISNWGHQATIAGGYTGFEALFYDNINFLIGFVLIVSIFAVGYYGSGGGG